MTSLNLNRRQLFLSTLIALFASTAAFSPHVGNSHRGVISDMPLKYASNAQDSGLPRATAALQYSQSKEWIRAYDALVRFQNQHGHFQVPAVPHRKLHKWVEHQRLAYQAKLAGQASPLTSSAISRLDAIGFDWDVSPAPLGSDKKSSSASVTKSTQSSTSVSRATSVVTSQSQAKLSVHNTLPKKSKRKNNKHNNTSPWMKNFYKLKKFQRQHGHLLVNPQTSLGQWLQQQKFVAKAQQLSSSSTMIKNRLSNHQYRLLEQLGVIKNSQLQQLEQDLYATFVDQDKTTEQQLEAWKERYGLA